MPVGARQRRDKHGIVALRLASPKTRAACGSAVHVVTVSVYST